MGASMSPRETAEQKLSRPVSAATAASTGTGTGTGTGLPPRLRCTSNARRGWPSPSSARAWTMAPTRPNACSVTSSPSKPSSSATARAEIRAQVRLTDPTGGERVVAMNRQLGYRFTVEIPVDQSRSAHLGRRGMGRSGGDDAVPDRAQARCGPADGERGGGAAPARDDPLSDRVISRAEASSSIARWQPSPRGTSSSPDPPGSTRPSTARCAPPSSGSTTSPRLASTSSTSHRSTRSDATIARASTTRSRHAPVDVGSPWAIGAAEAVTRRSIQAFGTLDDFDALVREANTRNLEIALDIAFQCAPDHPWVKEHPEVVLGAARRFDRLRGEPTEAIPGHSSRSTSTRRTGAASGAPSPMSSGSGTARRARFPRRQPAHQAVRVLGVADRRAQGAGPGDRVPRRGLRPPRRDDAAVARRVLRLVHALPVAALAVRHRALRRAARRWRQRRVLPRQRMGEHARHPHRRTAAGLPQVFISRLVLAATLRASPTACTDRCSKLQVADAVAQGSEEYASRREVTRCAPGISERPSRCAR